MTYIPKPKIVHPELQRNKLGLTARDYEGSLSTLCAGCGHDSITAAIIQAFWELDFPPHRLAKMSGIGCSSKTPAYFLNQAHGFNAVHGRMPSVTTGAYAANGALTYIGVSGDGDTVAIGLGQFMHAMRRNVNMLYIIENNGTYGLTKGQFSATSDRGSKSKRGQANPLHPIDPLSLALLLRASFVARSFSGDKAQLIPLIKAGLLHKGFSVIDVISPCVTFNNHEGSTKSYEYTRQHSLEAFHTDYIRPQEEISIEYPEGNVFSVDLFNGSAIRLRKLGADYAPSDPTAALQYVEAHRAKGEIVTGLIYLRDDAQDMHETMQTCDAPLNALPFEKLCPGVQKLEEILKEFR